MKLFATPHRCMMGGNEFYSRAEHERRLTAIERAIHINSASIVVLAVAICVLCAMVRSAEWQHPSRAIETALDDAEEHPDDAQYLIWVWNPEADPELTRLVSFSTNSSVVDLRETTVIRPAILDGGHLLRFDLRTLGDPAKIAKLLQEFGSDTRLYDRSGPAPRQIPQAGPDLLSFTTLVDADLRSDVSTLVKIPKGTAITSAKRETRGGIEWQQVTHGGHTGWVRADQLAKATTANAGAHAIVFGGHLGPDAVAAGLALQKLAANAVPLVEGNDFVRRAMTDLDDGLYSRFLGLPADYDDFLRLVGVDRKAAADSERRGAMFWSDVTRSQRAISFLPTLGAPVDSPRIHAITEDVPKDLGTDKKKIIDQQPLRNLLASKFVAGEAMTTGRNNRIIWSLWAFDEAGKGTLQKSVPDNIASNSRLTPDDRRLQSQIDCLECHTGTSNGVAHDGWRPWDNDARSLLKAVYADKKLSTADHELFSKLRARYDWEPGDSVRAWRDSFAVFVAQCDPLPDKDGEKQTPGQFGDALRSWRGRYLEAPVTSLQAAWELGLKATDEPTAIKALIDQIDDAEDGREDPVLIRLRLPRARITRGDWNQVYPEFLRRLKPEAIQ